MDDCYRINVCRGQLVDSDIPLLERVIAKYLGITGEKFHQSFVDAETVSFENEVCVDLVQECVFTLEEQGFKVSAEKIKRPAYLNAEQVCIGKVVSPKNVGALTYDDCQLLFSEKPKGIQRLAQYKSWVVFGCSSFVVSVYLLMVFLSV